MSQYLEFLRYFEVNANVDIGGTLKCLSIGTPNTTTFPFAHLSQMENGGY